MKFKLFTMAVLSLVMVSCSKSPSVDNHPIVGDYELIFTQPERVNFVTLTFKSDGNVDGRRNGVREENVYTYKVEGDTLLTLSHEFQGEIIETGFDILSQSPDSINLRMKYKLNRFGVHSGIMKYVMPDEVDVVEYDSRNDSIPVLAVLKRI